MIDKGLVKLDPQRNDFLALDGDGSRNVLMTIEALQPFLEPPRLRRRAKVATWTYMCDLSGNRYYILIMMLVRFIH